MTTPDNRIQRAPQAPMPAPDDTAPFPAPPSVVPIQTPGRPLSEAEAGADTAPEMQARAQANRAQDEADRAQANRQRAEAAAAAPWYRRPVEVIRERPAIGLGALGIIAIAACCAGAAGIYALEQSGLKVYVPGTEKPAAQYSGDVYACSQAADSGPRLRGATINTNGRGGAVVDDTLPGHPTEVTVIPPNTTVTVNGAVRYWLYNQDCTSGQIQGQAQIHAQKAGYEYLPDYHSLDGLGKANISPTSIAMHERIAQRKASRLQAELPIWKRIVSL